MFEQTFVDGEGRTNKSWTVVISTITQVTIVGIVLLIPLIYTDALPKTSLTSFLTAPPPPPPPPPPPAAEAPKVVKKIVREFDGTKLQAPKKIPKQIAMITEEEPPPASAGVMGGVPGGVPGGSAGGIIGGILGGVPSAAPPPPPPKKEEVKPKTPDRIRVGGNVQAANLVRRIVPVYPPLAKQARVQGTVKFSAIIGKDGTIQNLQLISGHPLLVPAATEAVKQWVYRPTLLNGEPVEVVTQIDVNFSLSS
ncbi:MAG TPA: energy transducer TonB [Bryobacteraceae bacterium]|jgi:protein TonB